MPIPIQSPIRVYNYTHSNSTRWGNTVITSQYPPGAMDLNLAYV